MAASPFAKVPMNHGKVQGVLLAAGIADLQVKEPKAGKLVQYLGTFEGTKFFLNIYINGGGNCTVGKSAGFDEGMFNHLAQLVVEGCRWGATEKLEQSLAKFDAKNVVGLVDFLESLGGQVSADEAGPNYKLTRIKGPHGDVLTLKFFTNGTLQLQGKHAQVAVWTQDFLRTVMPLDDFLEQQRAVYSLPVTVADTKLELLARIPNAHDGLVDEVRIQLSSALALTKVGVELEDYAALAFPALRGLEGFCFQLLHDDCGLAPPKNAQLGEYFVEVRGAPGSYGMRSPHGDGVAKSLQELLGKCYTTWHKQRHRLFHMDGTVETTRILEKRADAVSLVDEVFALVDQGYAIYLKSNQ